MNYLKCVFLLVGIAFLGSFAIDGQLMMVEKSMLLNSKDAEDKSSYKKMYEESSNLAFQSLAIGAFSLAVGFSIKDK